MACWLARDTLSIRATRERAWTPRQRLSTRRNGREAREGRTLRIAILIERFVPGPGGVETVAWNVAHELARVGETPTVFARIFDADSDVPVRAIKASAAWQPWRVHAFDRSATRALSGQKSLPFEIVHSFSRTRHQDLYRAGGGSHADFMRRTYSPVGQRLRQASPRHRILLAHERSVFADPNQRIQCSSRLVADALIEHEGVSADRIFLLPNGVDVARFQSPEALAAGARLRAEAPARFRQPADETTGPLWLFPGTGWKRKGLSVLLEALATRKAGHHRLWVAGRDAVGPWKKKVAALGLDARVTFLGEQRDLAPFYHAVDAMVLPSRYDPFANVTVEAAAAGLPIVTTRSNGASEWFPTEIEVVRDAEDVGALAKALTAYESAQRRAEDGKALADYAPAFDWSAHVEALRDEYERILQRRAGHPPQDAPR